MPLPWTARRTGPLGGTARVPGDKSISHRALMFAALAVGETRIAGLLEGEDVLGTAAALRAMGVGIERDAPGEWRVRGVGVGGLAEPESVLDFGNSGTSARLMMGLLATHGFTSIVTGDESLRRRPMRRVTDPLALVGARFEGRSAGRLPLAVIGTDAPMPVRYLSPVPSAQVKSALLLTGLAAPGRTTVVEREPTRDHTELMLRHFGATVTVEETEEGLAAAVEGEAELVAAPVLVPADPSSAAFPLVAALIVEGSSVRLPGIAMNARRTGLIATLREMGAAIAESDARIEGGEPVADLAVTAGPLRGVTVPAARAPSMIDEYPALAVAAAFAEGTTRMEGLAELRVKESDRLAAVEAGLKACGVACEAGPDWLAVHGHGHGRGRPPGGATVATHYDHRIAMAFLVLGLGADAPVRVDDARAVATSFPDFLALMRGLGAEIAAE